MKSNSSLKFISLFGLALAGIATVISEYAKQKEIEELIDTKVDEKIKKITEEEA